MSFTKRYFEARQLEARKAELLSKVAAAFPNVFTRGARVASIDVAEAEVMVADPAHRRASAKKHAPAKTSVKKNRKPPQKKQAASRSRKAPGARK